MSQRPSESIQELLRNSLPGYLFLAILIPLIPKLTSYSETVIVTLFVLSGPLVGLLMFNFYLVVYRRLTWHSGWIRRGLGLKQVTELIESFHGRSGDELRAIWDYVFFELGIPVTDRVLFQYSRGHSWGVIAMGLSLDAAVWAMAGNVVNAGILGAVAILIMRWIYPFAIKQGATLEDLIMELNWGRVETVANSLHWEKHVRK